jgi:hypothetical protein
MYSNVIEASQKMGSNFEAEYFPQADKVEKYAEFMEQYQNIADFVKIILKLEKMSTHYKELQRECYEANMQLDALKLVVYTFEM